MQHLVQNYGELQRKQAGAQKKESQYEKYVGNLLDELKDIRTKHNSQSDDMSQYIISDHFGGKKETGMPAGLHPDLPMSRPKNLRESFGQAKAARASFMVQNPVQLKAATDEKDKDKVISLSKLRRVSVIQKISKGKGVSQIIHPGEDSDIPYMSDNMGGASEFGDEKL